MNNPKKYNAWDMALCTQLAEKVIKIYKCNSVLNHLVPVPRSCREQEHEGIVWICWRKIFSLKSQVVIYTGAGKYHCAGGRCTYHSKCSLWIFKQAFYWSSLSEFLGRKTPRQLQRIIRWAEILSLNIFQTIFKISHSSIFAGSTMRKCSTCSSNSQSQSLLQWTGQA